MFKRLFRKEVTQQERFGEEHVLKIEVTDANRSEPEITQEKLNEAWGKSFQRPQHPYIAGKGTMDSTASIPFSGPQVGNYSNTVPPGVAIFFATQGFIGWQMCAVLSQQWLISKACLLPAEDAIRHGYELTRNDGGEFTPDELDLIRECDVRFRLKKHLIEFLFKGRIFGIRLAKFVVESDDKDYYEKPFNIDGVKPGTFKGIVQIDPYWVSPELDYEAGGNPNSEFFYEPTWWNISGQRVHRTHLCIFRTESPPDILKPSYFYGGIPIPQKIFNRVYAAERTANEAPMLALTKRTVVYKTDIARALANQMMFDNKMKTWALYRDNYGVKVADKDTDEVEQFDTSLTDFDSVLMTQYQLVAAASNVPATKLLGTSPKGFNTTGEYEEASYHEELENIQSLDLTPFLERYYALLMKSEIAPDNSFSIIVKWKRLDAMTSKEEAEVNDIKADTALKLMQLGAINAEDERKRVIADPTSGYSGLIDEDREEGEELDDFDESQNEMVEESGRRASRSRT